MKRKPLKNGTTIEINGILLTITEIKGDGANCVVYEAEYYDSRNNRHAVRIKECYPYNSDIQRVNNILKWKDPDTEKRDKQLFRESYDNLTSWQNNILTRNSTVAAFDIGECNGTLYSIMNADAGATFDLVKNDSLKDILETVLALAKCVKRYHDQGFLHLDLKPSNLLIIPETRELVILFDFDTVTKYEDIQSGKIKTIPYSEGWGAPEQIRGDIKKISPQTDIFSIGAILFEKTMGRKCAVEDMGLFAEWGFNETVFQNKDPKIKKVLRSIFKKSLSVNINRRYESIDSCICDLEEAVSIARDGKPFILPNIPACVSEFVGRQAELAMINTEFKNGKRIIFLNGEGGIGKTELARRYASREQNKYNLVYVLYNVKNIEEELEYIDLQNFHGSSQEKIKWIRRLLDKDSLLVIDNYSGEDLFAVADKYQCKFLITTRNKYSEYISQNNSITEIAVTELMPDQQMELFEKELGREIRNDEYQDIVSVLKCAYGLTILITAIAKYIKNGANTVKELRMTLQEKGLKGIPDHKVRMVKDGRMYHDSIRTLLDIVFDYSGLTNKHLLLLFFISIIQGDGIHFSRRYLLGLFGNDYYEPLDDLVFSGWLNTVVYNPYMTLLELHDVRRELLPDSADENKLVMKIIINFIEYLVGKIDKSCYYEIPERDSEYDLCSTIEECRTSEEYKLLIELIRIIHKNTGFSIEECEKVIGLLCDLYEKNHDLIYDYPVKIRRLCGMRYSDYSADTKLKCCSLEMLVQYSEIHQDENNYGKWSYFLTYHNMRCIDNIIDDILDAAEEFTGKEKKDKVQKALKNIFEPLLPGVRVVYPMSEDDVVEFRSFSEKIYHVGCTYWRKRSPNGIAYSLGLDEYADESWGYESPAHDLDYYDNMDYRSSSNTKSESGFSYEEYDYEQSMKRKVQNTSGYDDHWDDDDYWDNEGEKDFWLGYYEYETGDSIIRKEEVDDETVFSWFIGDSSYLNSGSDKLFVICIKLLHDEKKEEAYSMFDTWLKQETSKEMPFVNLDEVYFDGISYINLKECGLIEKLLFELNRQEKLYKNKCDDSDLYMFYYHMAKVYISCNKKDLVKETVIKMKLLANRDFSV